MNNIFKKNIDDDSTVEVQELKNPVIKVVGVNSDMNTCDLENDINY